PSSTRSPNVLVPSRGGWRTNSTTRGHRGGPTRWATVSPPCTSDPRTGPASWWRDSPGPSRSSVRPWRRPRRPTTPPMRMPPKPSANRVVRGRRPAYGDRTARGARRDRAGDRGELAGGGRGRVADPGPGLATSRPGTDGPGPGRGRVRDACVRGFVRSRRGSGTGALVDVGGRGHGVARRSHQRGDRGGRPARPRGRAGGPGEGRDREIGRAHV